MGNALMSRVRPAPEPEPAPVEEVLDPVRKLTMAGRNPRLSFYSKAKEKTEKLDDGRYGEMSWFDFLVHTELCTMNYDALSKSDEDQLAHLVRMLENMKVPATLRKPVEDVIPFVCEVKAKMPNNPYHNSRHVTDVTQCMYTLLLATKVAHRLEPIELAAAFVGAICHDLDHPGLSNTWQNNEQTELARKYDGESPLEHHHLDEFVALAAKYDLLGNIEPAQAARFKEIVTEMILTPPSVLVVDAPERLVVVAGAERGHGERRAGLLVREAQHERRGVRGPGAAVHGGELAREHGALERDGRERRRQAGADGRDEALDGPVGRAGRGALAVDGAARAGRHRDDGDGALFVRAGEDAAHDVRDAGDVPSQRRIEVRRRRLPQRRRRRRRGREADDEVELVRRVQPGADLGIVGDVDDGERRAAPAAQVVFFLLRLHAPVNKVAIRAKVPHELGPEGLGGVADRDALG